MIIRQLFCESNGHVLQLTPGGSPFMAGGQNPLAYYDVAERGQKRYCPNSDGRLSYRYSSQNVPLNQGWSPCS